MKKSHPELRTTRYHKEAPELHTEDGHALHEEQRLKRGPGSWDYIFKNSRSEHEISELE